MSPLPRNEFLSHIRSNDLLRRTFRRSGPRKFLICGESGDSRRLMTWASFFATGLPNASGIVVGLCCLCCC